MAPVDALPFANGFPFHIPPTGTRPGTAPWDLILATAPTQADKAVTIQGDRFILAETGEPIRFWGTNLCFSGAFPEHDIADRIAMRLSTLGVNIVRFHHFDQRRFPGGIWHRDSPGASSSERQKNFAHHDFDPESVDRLDYLIAALKKRGIYTNLNLKVSRYISPDYDGPDFPQPDPTKNEVYHQKGKGFDQFYTPAISMQKDYARRLLTHKNPYTGLTYAEDPAIAIVEINNENGILWAWNYNMLDRIPSRFLNELAARWNTWLHNRYSTTNALRAAWAPLATDNLIGLPANQGLVFDNTHTPDIHPVEWVLRRDLLSRTPAVITDVMYFLRDTETAYWHEMRNFLRNELHVAANITTTAVGYTTSQIAAETADFVDTHRYWSTPRFPGYDRSKPWTVEQKAMVGHPFQSTIERISARRVFGKPFTITEYNHPPSSDHHAEGFPLISIYGAAQDWDGIFQFAYVHDRNWDSNTMNGFFSTQPNPAHTVTALAASDIFLHHRIAPFTTAETGYVTLERQIERQNNRAFPREIEADAIFGGLPPDAWLTHRVGLVPNTDYHLNVEYLHETSADQSIVWDAAYPATAHVRYIGDGVAGLIGFVYTKTLDLGWIRITPGDTSLDGFSVVMLNSVDRQPLGASGRYLLTTVVRAANLGMGWNAERTGFDKQWGIGPVHVETVPVTLDFALPDTAGIRVYPLNPDGTRQTELMPSSIPSRFEATPASKTLWFEIILP